jgi:hypothetical protein
MSARSEIEERVASGVASVVETTAFKEWLAIQKKVAPEDLIVINNSFIYRDRVSTKKNERYLSLNPTDASSVNLQSLGVVLPSEQKVDFKLITFKSKSLPETHDLKQSIEEQLKSVGSLVFVLIGAIDDYQITEVNIDHQLFTKLRFDPSINKFVSIEPAERIVTNRLDDPEQLWEWLEAEALRMGLIQNELPGNLEAPLSQAFVELQNSSYSLVRFPSGSSSASSESILGRIAQNLLSQVEDYERHLKDYENDTSQRAAFNDVLRISYNFSSDATKFIELIISVCDVKPIVLWCTMREHYELAEAFRALPWLRDDKKPSLGKYETTISRARNRAFHNLFPFERSLEVDVSGLSIRPRHLRFFPAYAGSRKRAEALGYEDKEIVDVLAEFTRAPETAVSLSFWKRNLDVMKSTIELINATQNTLWLLRQVV